MCSSGGRLLTPHLEPRRETLLGRRALPGQGQGRLVVGDRRASPSGHGHDGRAEHDRGRDGPERESSAASADTATRRAASRTSGPPPTRSTSSASTDGARRSTARARPASNPRRTRASPRAWRLAPASVSGPIARGAPRRLRPAPASPLVQLAQPLAHPFGERIVEQAGEVPLLQREERVRIEL
jgi:hypothetical protein